MNLGQLRTRVKELIHKIPTTAGDDTGRPKNSEINQMINEARNLIYSELAVWGPQRFGSSTTLAYTANAASTPLPAAARQTQIFYVYYTQGGDTFQYVLQPVGFGDFINYSELGNSMVYAVNNTDLFLRPAPTGAVTVTIFYLPSLTDLSADGDTPSELPSSFQHILAYKAAIKWLKSTNDPASSLGDEANEIMDQMQRFYEKMIPDNRIHESNNSGYWNGGL